MVQRIFLSAVLLLSIASSMPGQEHQWYRGNLHTHSLWSDGNDFPEMITRWYVEHDYDFLTMTDHNVLSEGERWMKLDAIEKRGGVNALEKYKQAMGADWVETRPNGIDAENKNAIEVRLKTLQEYRGKFESPGKFLLMTGEEISDRSQGLPVHMNATNLVKIIRPAGGSTVREAIAGNMRSAIEQAKRQDREILVHLNHPNFGWAVTAEDLAFVLEEKFFEIFNGHPSVNQLGDNLHPSLEKIWDIANTIRVAKLSEPPLYGFATDDCHNYHDRKGSTPGRGWIMVRAKELQPDALLKSIKAGDFYASSGASINSVAWDSQTGKLEISIKSVPGETFTTRFVGTPKDYDDTSSPRVDKDGKKVRGTRIYSEDVGKTFASIEGNNPSYQMTGEELYVRAVITSSADHPNPSWNGQKKQAWVQPVVWKQK